METKKVTYIITPRKGIASAERYNLTVSAEDHAKMSRGEQWAATMTDIPSGQQYTVSGAPCGIPTCFCDAVATQVVEARTETIYHETIFFTADDLGEVKGDKIIDVLENIRDDAERAIELLKTDGVELTDVFWDKHPRGYGLAFETTDTAVAREQGFWEMLLPPGADVDEDDLDWELTPWKREAEGYRALVKVVGEAAAKTIGEQIVAKFPSNEMERATTQRLVGLAGEDVRLPGRGRLPQELRDGSGRVRPRRRTRALRSGPPVRRGPAQHRHHRRGARPGRRGADHAWRYARGPWRRPGRSAQPALRAPSGSAAGTRLR
jgi:hypothetical protein